jgi:hypothetical protein
MDRRGKKQDGRGEGRWQELARSQGGRWLLAAQIRRIGGDETIRAQTNLNGHFIKFYEH